MKTWNSSTRVRSFYCERFIPKVSKDGIIAPTATSIFLLFFFLSGCQESKIESFKRFCMQESSISVFDSSAWQQYLSGFRQNSETSYRIVNISEKSGFEVVFSKTPDLIMKEKYVPNDISIYRGSEKVAIVRSFSFKYTGFEGENYANCALSFPEFYKV